MCLCVQVCVRMCVCEPVLGNVGQRSSGAICAHVCVCGACALSMNVKFNCFGGLLGGEEDAKKRVISQRQRQGTEAGLVLSDFEAQLGPSWVAKSAQERLMSGQGRPKSGPRAAKSGPRAAKSGPGAAQERPKAANERQYVLKHVFLLFFERLFKTDIF